MRVIVGKAESRRIASDYFVASKVRQNVLEPRAVHAGWVDEELLPAQGSRARKNDVLHPGLEFAEHIDDVERRLRSQRRHELPTVCGDHGVPSARGRAQEKKARSRSREQRCEVLWWDGREDIGDRGCRRDVDRMQSGIDM